MYFQIDVDSATLDNMDRRSSEKSIGQGAVEIRCGEGVSPLRVAGILPAIRGQDARATGEQGQDALATKEVYYGDMVSGDEGDDVESGGGTRAGRDRGY